MVANCPGCPHSPGVVASRRRRSLTATHLQHSHHAQTARRVTLSQACGLASSGKSQRYFRASRCDEEGRFGRSSRNVGRDAMDADARRTRRVARGRRNRGVLISRRWDQACGATCRRRGLFQPGTPGRARYKPYTIARGMPVVRLNLWYLPPAFFVAGGPWVRPSPGIPCALSIVSEGMSIAALGRNASRDCEAVSDAV